MANRQTYHISVRVAGEAITVREQLNRTASVPTTQIDYTPPLIEQTIPVTIYWKSGVIDTLHYERVNQAVIDYCAHLYSERDYEGPINCCL